MNNLDVVVFTIEAHGISEKNREEITNLLEVMMDDYNDVAFEPKVYTGRVQVDTYENAGPCYKEVK